MKGSYPTFSSARHCDTTSPKQAYSNGSNDKRVAEIGMESRSRDRHCVPQRQRKCWIVNENKKSGLAGVGIEESSKTQLKMRPALADSFLLAMIPLCFPWRLDSVLDDYGGARIDSIMRI